MSLAYPSSPLTELSLPRLQARRSLKWRQYPPDVLPLWVAEMDTPLAPAVRDALADAVASGDTGYVHPGRLAEAFAGFARDRLGWGVDPARCWLTPDVMQAVAAALQVLTRPGDGVVINPPVYPPFASVVTAAGRHVVSCPLIADRQGRWGLDLERLEQELSRPEVTAYLLCSPHNPTGTAFSRQELLAVAQLAERYGVQLLVDEIHGPLTYPPAVFTPFQTLPATAAVTASVIFTSASKAWNLAGLKAALAVAGPDAPAALTPALRRLRIGTSLFGAIAAQAAFTGGAPWLERLLTGLDANRHLLAQALAAMLPEVRYRPPDATYLAWLDCRALPLGDAADPGNPARWFLDSGRVAVNAGSSFGAPGQGYVRINFATSPEILLEGVRRMAGSLPDGPDRVRRGIAR